MEHGGTQNLSECIREPAKPGRCSSQWAATLDITRQDYSGLPTGTGGEVANALVCKTSTRGFNSRPVLQLISTEEETGLRSPADLSGESVSVLLHRGVDLIGPGKDAASQIGHLLIAGLLQELCDTLAAPA
jgi:hypothetical protein